jgi:glycosyltransferase involved in cell wall biosynthesis
MGWRPPLKRQCGRPPEWAETMNVDACPVPEFLHSLDCLVTINGGAQENWPRVGLEAMAAGVPIVTEKRWGWLEMIEHGVSGFLGETTLEMAHYATELAHNEFRRLEVAHAARRHVEKIADPQSIWESWQKLFAQLGGGEGALGRKTPANDWTGNRG